MTSGGERAGAIESQQPKVWGPKRGLKRVPPEDQLRSKINLFADDEKIRGKVEMPDIMRPRAILPFAASFYR